MRTAEGHKLDIRLSSERKSERQSRTPHLLQATFCTCQEPCLIIARERGFAVWTWPVCSTASSLQRQPKLLESPLQTVKLQAMASCRECTQTTVQGGRAAVFANRRDFRVHLDCNISTYSSSSSSRFDLERVQREASDRGLAIRLRSECRHGDPAEPCTSLQGAASFISECRKLRKYSVPSDPVVDLSEPDLHVVVRVESGVTPEAQAPRLSTRLQVASG